MKAKVKCTNSIMHLSLMSMTLLSSCILCRIDFSVVISCLTVRDLL